MKKYMLVLFIITASNLHAQSSGEWLKQKETRIKYMLQQIAANKVYIEYLQKGYGIAQSGLQTINNIKHGDFNVHSGFFNALSVVNPKIKNLVKVAGIIDFQMQIIRDAKTAMGEMITSGQFTTAEWGYVQNVFNHLLDECAKNINDLITVMTSGEIEMGDEERIKRVDQIYDSMQDKLSFCKSFSADAKMLAIQRRDEQTEIEIMRNLNGLR